MIKIKLTPEIMALYKAGFNKHRAVGKWSSAKGAAVISATLAGITKEDGSALVLSELETTVTDGVANSTTKSKLATFDLVLAQHGIELDPEVKKLFAKLFNTASVQKQIDDADKPQKLRLKDLIAD